MSASFSRDKGRVGIFVASAQHRARQTAVLGQRLNRTKPEAQGSCCLSSFRPCREGQSVISHTSGLCPQAQQQARLRWGHSHPIWRECYWGEITEQCPLSPLNDGVCPTGRRLLEPVALAVLSGLSVLPSERTGLAGPDDLQVSAKFEVRPNWNSKPHLNCPK